MIVIMDDKASGTDIDTLSGCDYNNNTGMNIQVTGPQLENYIKLHHYNQDIYNTYQAYFRRPIINSEVPLEPIINMCDGAKVISDLNSDLIIYHQDFTLDQAMELINMTTDYDQKLVKHGFPVRIGPVAFINGEVLFDNNTILYPRTRRQNTLTPDFIPAAKIVDDRLIPRHIFQTFETRVVPNILTANIEAWIHRNPEYNYHYYTGAKSREFIADYFDATVLEAYDNLVPGAFKADLWRYCALYHYGGVYIDIKMYPKLKLDQIINDEDELILVRDLKLRTGSKSEEKPSIFNAFMAVKPRHPFIKLLIDKVIENVQRRALLKCLEITGPDMIRDILDQCKDEYMIRYLDLVVDVNVYDTVIIDNNNNTLLYRRNPHEIQVSSDHTFKISSGKPHYTVLCAQNKIYKD